MKCSSTGATSSGKNSPGVLQNRIVAEHGIHASSSMTSIPFQ